MKLLDIDDGRGDVWLMLEDAGFRDVTNVVLTREQAEELHSLLGHWLQDYYHSEMELVNAMRSCTHD